MTGPLKDVLALMHRVLDDGCRRHDLPVGTSRSESGEIPAAIGDASEQIDVALRECDTAARQLTTYLAEERPRR